MNRVYECLPRKFSKIENIKAKTGLKEDQFYSQLMELKNKDLVSLFKVENNLYAKKILRGRRKKK